MLWLFVLALIFLLFGWLSVRRGTTLQHETGLPTGRLIYADSHRQDWRPTETALYSATHHLVGKPDYIVETSAGLIPVEVKSAPAPPVPYLGHLLQLAAYCLLIEETNGQTPPHGLLKYADAPHEVDFTRELRPALLDTLADIRQARPAEDVGGTHNQPGQCAARGCRRVCDDTSTQGAKCH